MALLAPSILSADFSNLLQQIKAVEKGGADIIHCDIMDGIFVPNITFGPKIVNTVNKITELPLDVHLMIKNPENIIHDFINAGADFITVHQEEVIHLDRVINLIKEKGAEAGVVLNPATPIETIFPVLDILDIVLIMSVNPGFGGQSFIEYTLQKVKKLKEIKEINNHHFKIEIDGGVNSENIKKIKNAGAEIIVAGTAVFKSENITEKVKQLKNSIT
ncbi:MAG: ribulose-phosphate 3-epimerase [Ignavibacteriae bacterium]|nr:MAG: ribulose-phosphate 3-epimerase [Ignavibacteriota bacterium]